MRWPPRSIRNVRSRHPTKEALLVCLLLNASYASTVPTYTTFKFNIDKRIELKTLEIYAVRPALHGVSGYKRSTLVCYCLEGIPNNPNNV